MTCSADANVLFPLLVQGHVAHEAADVWWNEQPDGSVGTCLLARLAVLRLLTNQVAMNGRWQAKNTL
jgi:predicted nucleic acid-binding protein